MKTRIKMLCLSLALASSGVANAQTPVDVSVLDRHMPGPPTQVLVLGSVHLSQGGPEHFDPASLQPVLQRLMAYKPDIITIEALSGETCALMRRRPEYKATAADYCPDVAAAKVATGLDVLPALDAIDAALATWPAHPAAAQRRHLAALFLAAGDPSSAVVQWWQLPESERHAGDGLDEALVQAIRKREAAPNENVHVAARLAVQLGLQRIYPVDDHTGDSYSISDEGGYDAAITKAWNGASKEAIAARDRVQALHNASDMLATYRLVNTPDYLRLAIAADFGQAMAEPSPQRFGRQYVGGWETRNLRMVANIRATFRTRPGVHVLSIVGSSHKPWFDSLLGHMQGVDIVDAEWVLK